MSKSECIQRAHAVVQSKSDVLAAEGIEMKLDYIEMTDPETFETMSKNECRSSWESEAKGRPVILSGAMWVGKTRLIDNIILGDEKSLGVLSQ